VKNLKGASTKFIVKIEEKNMTSALLVMLLKLQGFLCLISREKLLKALEVDIIHL